MTVALHVLPENYTLLGINYEKLNILNDEDADVCYQISIGFLFLILKILIYKKGDE